MSTDARTPLLSAPSLLWIDRVGVFLLWWEPRLTVGGPVDDDRGADLRLLAPLSRRHAVIERGASGYVLEPLGPVRLNERDVSQPVLLSDSCELTLGESVRLRFTQPSLLSASARIDFPSGHRTQPAVDGVILFSETCLLGSGPGNHVDCGAEAPSVVLVRRGSALWCHAREPLVVDDEPAGNDVRLKDGSIVELSELRFRLESLRDTAPV